MFNALFLDNDVFDWLDESISSTQAGVSISDTLFRERNRDHVIGLPDEKLGIHHRSTRTLVGTSCDASLLTGRLSHFSVPSFGDKRADEPCFWDNREHQCWTRRTNAYCWAPQPACQIKNVLELEKSFESALPPVKTHASTIPTNETDMEKYNSDQSSCHSCTVESITGW